MWLILHKTLDHIHRFLYFAGTGAVCQSMSQCCTEFIVRPSGASTARQPPPVRQRCAQNNRTTRTVRETGLR